MPSPDIAGMRRMESGDPVAGFALGEPDLPTPRSCIVPGNIPMPRLFSEKEEYSINLTAYSNSSTISRLSRFIRGGGTAIHHASEYSDSQQSGSTGKLY